MKTDTPKQQTNRLHQRLLAVSEGTGMALSWIDSSRHSAGRLDMEADRLKAQLRRCRTRAQHLSAAVSQQNALALYGLSQEGKAWLLTSLVADSNGRLETQLADKTLDYFTHINPHRADCDVVTRFSHQADVKNKKWPVELTLLNEADLTRLIASVWLQNPGSQPDEQQIRLRLQTLSLHRQPEVVAGITCDEMVGLYDYLQRHDASGQTLLARHFWPMALELAPRLSIDDRARLFSLLWGDDDALTQLWRQLAHTLQLLAGAEKVLAPLSLLVDDAQLPAEALLAPAAAASLNTQHDREIQICPRRGGRAAQPVTASLAELALLTVEITIPLHSVPREALFEQTEVLDIPGFGDPVDAYALQERERICQHYPLIAQLLRAKRGYLPERYAERQEIALLMVCSAAGQRADVKPVSQALDYWVKQTRGDAGPARAGRKPALIWAVTQFDWRHFQQQNHDEAVQRRIGQPGDVWGTMLAQDRGGVQRMARWLEAEVRPEAKLERIQEQLQELQRKLGDNLLASWLYDDAADDSRKKQQIGETLLKALQTRTGLHGELLEHLQPSREELRCLYQQRELSPQVEKDPGRNMFGIGVEIDLFSDEPIVPSVSAAASPALNDDAQFAVNVQRYWINHLRSLPDNDALLSLLGISKATMELLVEELIVASFRLNIGGALHDMLTGSESAHTPREDKTDRQVSRALTVLGDFVSWLGFLQQHEEQRPESRINRGHKIFARPPAPDLTRRLTQLSAAPANATAFYIYDWLVGLNALILQNSGHASGAELNAEARARLEKIIAHITS